MSMLTARSLTSGYGRIVILRDVALDVKEGEALGILGHNGMGKTTLLRTLAGHIRALGGQVTLGIANITVASPAHRARLGLGYVPQGRQIFPNLTVQDNLRMGAAGKGIDDGVLEEVLAELPRLKPLLGRRGGVLSGGEQQILALGRCLCGKPRLILLDEPTEGIQPSIIQEMIEVLHSLKCKRRMTFVLVEQNLNFIRQLSDRVLILQKGEIRGELQPHQLGDATRVTQFLGMGEETQAA